MPAGGLTPAGMNVVEEAESSTCRWRSLSRAEVAGGGMAEESSWRRSLSATTVLRVVGRELLPAPPL